MTSLPIALEGAARAAPAPAAAGERLHALDGLRATAMLLGIVLHAAASLALLPIPWPAHDVSRSAGFDALLGFIHGFRMQVFFFMAGFFGHLVWRRLGPRGFLLQRGQRIGIPLLAGLVVIIPVILLLWKWADLRTGSTFMQRQERNVTLLSYPTAHLWFLEVLLILYLIAAALAQLGRWPQFASRLARIDAAFDWLMRQPFKPLLLAVPTLALLWGGPHIPDIDDAGMRLLPSAGAVAYYGLFFAVGWWLHRRIHLMDVVRNWQLAYFATALVAFIAMGAGLQAAMSPATARNWTAIKLAVLGACAIYAWCMTFALTGLFLRIAGGHRPWVRYLADASYWWYLWHLPIVMLLQIWIVDWPVNGWLKLLAMLILTTAILLPSYHTMVRYTWIGRILNGPRERG
jgi:glucan biosynthesis protein C